MVPVEVAIERLRNPKPGGKIWEAKEYGIDLTLLMSTLHKTREERILFGEDFADAMQEIRGVARKRHERKNR